MARKDDLPLGLRRRFLSGRPAIDLVHTGGPGDHARWEIIHGPEDLTRWLGVILGLDLVGARPEDMSTLHSLRAAIARAAYATAAGDRLSPGDLKVINRVAAAPPLVAALAPDRTRSYPQPTAAAALATIARDAVDLLSGPLSGRIRVCAATDCGLLFVDTSRPGSRRWCSMQRCGNLAKVRAHRSRQQ